MEYTEMIDKVKVLAAQNRAAKTAEDKAEVRRQMDALKESDLRLLPWQLAIWLRPQSSRPRIAK